MKLEQRSAMAERPLKIGVDIDGVLADIVQLMLPLLTRECGRPIEQDDIVCYHFGKALRISEQRVEALMEELIEGSHYELVPPIEGAVEGLARLSGHSIWLVTARPERVLDQTTRWLATHGMSFHKLVFASPLSKARRVDGFDLFVEDNLDAAVALSGQGIPVLLFDRPWNRHPYLPQNVSRVRDWAQIVDAVERLSCA